MSNLNLSLTFVDVKLVFIRNPIRNPIIFLIKEVIRKRIMRLTLRVMNMVTRLRTLSWRSLKTRPLSTERPGWWSRRREVGLGRGR